MYNNGDTNSTLLVIIWKIKFKSVCEVFCTGLLKYCKRLIDRCLYHCSDYSEDPQGSISSAVGEFRSVGLLHPQPLCVSILCVFFLINVNAPH